LDISKQIYLGTLLRRMSGALRVLRLETAAVG
jgi:hypothetical protein